MQKVFVSAGVFCRKIMETEGQEYHRGKIMLNVKCFAVFAFAGLFFLFTITGCARQGTVILENEEGRVIIESDGDENHSVGDEPYYSNDAPRIPKGHMPPAGKCRIWYPDRPPGHQPPPGDCEALKYRVPRGAWLIRG
jgi:hypothetical protein